MRSLTLRNTLGGQCRAGASRLPAEGAKEKPRWSGAEIDGRGREGLADLVNLVSWTRNPRHWFGGSPRRRRCKTCLP